MARRTRRDRPTPEVWMQFSSVRAQWWVRTTLVDPEIVAATAAAGERQGARIGLTGRPCDGRPVPGLPRPW